MKKISVIGQLKWLLPLFVVLIFLALAYQQFSCYSSRPFVYLAEEQQQKLQQYQRVRAVVNDEFKLQPRQSSYCARRLYCIEQSTAVP
jgi:hypothetical protein